VDIESHLSALERPNGDPYLAARQQILGVGEDAIEPLVDAFRKGRIAGWVCFDLLLAIGPAGRQAALDSTRRDGQEGAQALMALGKLKEPLPEILPLMRDSLDHSDRANVLDALSVFIELQPKAEPAFGDGGAEEFLVMGLKLRTLLDRPDPPIQEQAARAIGPRAVLWRRHSLYRNPVHQIHHPGSVRNSRHPYGCAADLQTFPVPRTTAQDSTAARRFWN
jgi:hypothetical protein